MAFAGGVLLALGLGYIGVAALISLTNRRGVSLVTTTRPTPLDPNAPNPALDQSKDFVRRMRRLWLIPAVLMVGGIVLIVLAAAHGA